MMAHHYHHPNSDEQGWSLTHGTIIYLLIYVFNFGTLTCWECNLTRIVDSSPSGAHKMYYNFCYLSLSSSNSIQQQHPAAASSSPHQQQQPRSAFLSLKHRRIWKADDLNLSGHVSSMRESHIKIIQTCLRLIRFCKIDVNNWIINWIYASAWTNVTLIIGLSSNAKLVGTDKCRPNCLLVLSNAKLVCTFQTPP